MRVILRVAAVLSAAVVCRTAAPAVSTAPVRPNLMFIVDMHRDILSWTSEDRKRTLTPNLDRMALEETEQHIASPVCSLSPFSCLKVRYASRYTAPRFQKLAQQAGQTVAVWNTDILPGDVTLPRLLHAGSYRSGFVGNNDILATPKWPLVPEDGDSADSTMAAALRAIGGAARGATRSAGFDFAGGVYRENQIILRPWALREHRIDGVAALEFIDSASPDQPFFFAPALCHAPYEPERSWQANPRATPDGLFDKFPLVLPAHLRLSEGVKAVGIQGRKREMLLWLDDAIGGECRTSKRAALRAGDWKYMALRYSPHPERSLDLRKPGKYGSNSRLIVEKANPRPPPRGHIGGNNDELKTLRGQPACFDADQPYDVANDPGEQTNLATRIEFADRLADMKARLRRFLDELPGDFAELKSAETGDSALIQQSMVRP